MVGSTRSSFRLIFWHASARRCSVQLAKESTEIQTVPRLNDSYSLSHLNRSLRLFNWFRSILLICWSCPTTIPGDTPASLASLITSRPLRPRSSIAACNSGGMRTLRASHRRIRKTVLRAVDYGYACWNLVVVIDSPKELPRTRIESSVSPLGM